MVRTPQASPVPPFFTPSFQDNHVCQQQSCCDTESPRKERTAARPRRVSHRVDTSPPPQTHAHSLLSWALVCGTGSVSLISNSLHLSGTSW